MKKVILILVFGLLCCSFTLFTSCEDETITDYPFLKDGSEIPEDLNSVTISYESFFKVKYGLRYPFLKTQSHFYFFETYLLQLFQYNLTDSTWKSNFTYTTNEYISTSKYFCTSGDSVVMISYFENNHSIDIYSINSETLMLKLLKKNLILDQNLYTTFQSTILFDNDKIIILLHTADKILTIDMKNFAISYSQDYHLNGSRHDSSVNSSAMMGRVNRDVYLYYYSFKRFFRFNLDSYLFTEIPVPIYLSTRMNGVWDKGAVVSNYFCFWPNDSYLTLCYEVNKNVWLTGGQNPFYEKGYLPFDYTFEGKNSYYQNGSVMQKISIK